MGLGTEKGTGGQVGLKLKPRVRQKYKSHPHFSKKNETATFKYWNYFEPQNQVKIKSIVNLSTVLKKR